MYTLGKQVIPPSTFLSAVLPTGVPLKPFGKSGDKAAFKGDTLVGFVRSDTGESRVFPSFEALSPGNDSASAATAIAKKLVSDPWLFPPDDTTLVPLPPVILSTSQSTRCKGKPPTCPEELLAFVQIQRLVGEYPVIGPGTQAAIGVDGCGCGIRAFAHRYKPAKKTDHYMNPLGSDQIVEAIMNDVSNTCERVNITIDNVTIAYWDSGNDYLQPIFTYSGSIRSSNSTTHSLLSGSVSVNKSMEPFTPRLSPEYPTNDPHYRRLRRRATSDLLSVGRYVVRADSPDWVNSATGFLDSLNNSTALGSANKFLNTQYFGADSTMFTSNKNDNVNSVQIALVEAHGATSQFSTYKSNGDVVQLSDIGASGGLGPSAGGNLSHLILHASQVIQTQADQEDSFAVWWDIFKGMHSAVGYRLDSYLNDDVTSNVGLYTGLGSSVVPTWFTELAANNGYGLDTAGSINQNTGLYNPAGRGSSVSVCGYADSTINDVEDLGPADCLKQHWVS